MHVSYLIKNGNKALGITKSLKKKLNLDCMIILYKTLERPKLEYNSIVWNNLSLTKRNGIETVQRKFIAMLCDTFLKKKLFYNYFLLRERILALITTVFIRFYFFV